MRTPGGEATVGPPAVVGRDAELARLEALLADAGSGHPAVIVIRAESGGGKTHLLDALARRAREAGWRCVEVRGVEAEAVLPGAGLLSLAQPLRSAVGSLPRVQQDALAAAIGWTTADGPGDRFLVGAATLALLSAGASEQPLLVAVDDVQWVDAESADAVLFAARRLGHDRAAVVLTHRSGTALPVTLDGIDTLGLEGLGAAAARALLGSGYAAEVVGRLAAETGGNPLALLECDRLLEPAQRIGAAALPRVLPAPERLRQVYADELAALSPAAWRTVVLGAASGDRDAAPVLAAAASEGLDPVACLAGCGDVLREEDGTLAFRHPLLRSVAWQRASPAERISAHRSLAGVMTDRAARARHLAEATPGTDPDLADELAAVADDDRSRRGFAAASRALERAALLTPGPALRASRLAAATEDAYVAGDAGRVRRLARTVLEGEAGAGTRARVLLTLGMLEWSHGPVARARELFEEAARLAGGGLLLTTLRELFHTCHLLDDTAGMVAAAHRAAAAADPGDPEQAMLAAYLTGAAHVVEGHPERGAPLLHRAVALLEDDPRLRHDPRHLVVSLLCARWLMDPTVAAGYAERRIDRARETGALGVLATGLSVYAMGSPGPATTCAPTRTPARRWS